jgi:hypothetical protein
MNTYNAIYTARFRRQFPLEPLFLLNFLCDVPQFRFSQQASPSSTPTRHSVQWTQQLDFAPITDHMISLLCSKLQQPGVCAISDGSPKDGNGAAAWIITDSLPEDGTLVDLQHISGGFRVPGPDYSQDSYRCELAGLLAILSVIREFIKQFHLPEVYLSIACDGKGALQRLFSQDRPASITDSQWDMVLLAQDLLRAMPGLTLCWRHVKGHQDDNKTAELDQWAQLNIEMDLCAKRSRTSIDHIPYIPSLASQWTILINTEVVPTNVLDNLRFHCLAPPAFAYWTEHDKLGSGSALAVHWQALGLAMREMDHYRRRFVTKHSSGWCGVGTKLKLWKFEDSDLCPRCSAPAETALHVWVCPDESTSTLWRKKISTLGAAGPDTEPLAPDFRDYARPFTSKRRWDGLQHSKADGLFNSPPFRKDITNFSKCDAQENVGLYLS